ncbi:hypothetical protein QNH39_12860 [Neobacillus novalis]|uniref:Uncharacterized protein n=1 Tax=Neobacillus novalis TaxID=220687 RepID=A0AA95SDC2_9BACI|nr:hypothetical protein [Neobacillus novalis]WHY88664.1 hypothetical protein QNH39_12860 [Neobacillus novalis]
MESLIFIGLPIVIIAFAIALFWAAGLPKIKRKKLSFVMIGLGLNVITTPLALFIGVMATDSPTSTTNNFWAGFLFIQGIPLLILIIGILKWFIDRGKNK